MTRADSGELEPVLRLPILQCHSRESGDPVHRSIAGVTGSPFAGDDTADRFNKNEIRSDLIASSRRWAFAGLVAVACATLPAGPRASAQSGPAPPVSYTDLSGLLLSWDNSMLRIDPNLPQAPGWNFSAIHQYGANNSASADVAGFGNRTIQFQNGVGDSSALSVVGSQNAVSTLQRGSNDQSSISVLGQNNRITDVQIGSNLSFGLQQVGNGSNVVIQQYRR